jgi:FKBP-type peptidyl-prolyl cis-trans isomerase
MKLILPTALLAVTTVFSMLAEDAKIDAKPSAPPDKAKVSYALGMSIGAMHKRSDEVRAHTDILIFTQALQDTLDGKPTQLKETELKPILERVGSEGLAAQSDADKKKISYAGGMRMALQIKSKYNEADGASVVQGFMDVVYDKPTKFQESEVKPLLEHAIAWGKLKQSEKNKAEGESFLAKNAKEPGIKALPDGLQYQVLNEGAGAIPSTNDMIYIKLRGQFVDGRQFIKHNHYLIRCGGGCQAWQDALPRMKIGSKWKIFVPPNLAFGEPGEPAWGVGPDATLVFDLETVSIAPPNSEFGRGRLGHAFEDSDIPDAPEDKVPTGSQTQR